MVFLGHSSNAAMKSYDFKKFANLEKLQIGNIWACKYFACFSLKKVNYRIYFRDALAAEKVLLGWTIHRSRESAHCMHGILIIQIDHILHFSWILPNVSYWEKTKDFLWKNEHDFSEKPQMLMSLS